MPIVNMAVRAMYNYTYEYEGCKITFKKDEEFQLLTKSNKDWWQVRRWSEGCAQDIYVPAVYVKEVKSEPQKKESLYQNISDVRKQMEKLSTKEQSNGEVGGKLKGPPAILKKSPKESNDPSDPVVSPRRKPPLVAKRSVDQLSDDRPNHIDFLSKSAPLSVLERLNRPPSIKKMSEGNPPPATNPKPRSKSTANDLETAPKDLPSPQESGPAFRLPPPTKPKSQKPVRDRPKSMLVTSPSAESPPEAVEPQLKVTAVASALEAAFAARQLSKESDSVKRSSSGPKHHPVDVETSKPALNLRKTPSPKTEMSNLSAMVSVYVLTSACVLDTVFV